VPEALADVFLSTLAPEHRERFVDRAALEASLAAVVEKGRAAWPSLELEAEGFVTHLAQRFTPELDLATVHAGDLWLAFGCVLGDPSALSAFERTVLVRVPTVLRGNLPAGMTEDDVLQALRLKLFVRQGEQPPSIAGYSGRGALVHWLRAAAVRVTQDFARSRRLEVATPDDALLETPAGAPSADLAYVKERYGPEFKAAFQEALTSLSPKEQNLLRLYYLDGSTPDDIGKLYQTHRTTVWRWLTQGREALLSKTRELLAARLKVGEGEFSSLMNVVHSQLDVSLNRLLKKP
jgi:RNA polymerase sigma-70 factor, ECF subfamily